VGNYYRLIEEDLVCPNVVFVLKLINNNKIHLHEIWCTTLRIQKFSLPHRFSDLWYVKENF